MPNHEDSDLQSVQRWSLDQPGGAFSTSGSLMAIDVAGVGSVAHTFGQAAADLLFSSVVARTKTALPQEMELLRGSGNTLFAWLPSMTGIVAQAFISHLRQSVCGQPVAMPGGEQITPRLLAVATPVEANHSVQEAIRRLEQELVGEPEMSAIVGIQRAGSARVELAHRLEAMRLFGRDGMIDKIMESLNLPVIEASTTILLGPPQAGKTRVLTGLAYLINGQMLPLAEITCRPSDQSVPFSLLAAIAYRFLDEYSVENIRVKLASLCAENPWLHGLFPILADDSTALTPLPPDDWQHLREVFEELLYELIRTMPHVAIVHSMHMADPESLASLADLQKRVGHGFRLVAGADPEKEQLPYSLRAFEGIGASIITLPSLKREQILEYLREVTPDIAQPAIADALMDATGGLLVTLESTLLMWAEDGRLTYRDNRWEFFPEKVKSSPAVTFFESDRIRLGQAAVANLDTISLLSALWRTDEADARQTVERARMLGYFSPEDPREPEKVRFADQDAAASFAAALSPAEQRLTHAEAGALLESAHSTNAMRYSPDLAYHFKEAGSQDRAEVYLKNIEESLSQLLPALASPTMPAIGGSEYWDITPAPALDDSSTNKVIDAVLMIRLVGVQFRLYPSKSEIVRSAIRMAIKSLERLFVDRPSLVITFDGHNIAFDGQLVQRRDLQIPLKDYVAWMSLGNLHAIGFARGVREHELGRFMELLAKFEDLEGNPSLLNQVLGLNMVNIRVLSRSFQPNLSQSNAGAPAAQTFDSNAPPAGFPAIPNVIPLDLSSDNMPSMAQPGALDDTTWAMLPTLMERASANARRVVLANLSRWLGDAGVSHEREKAHSSIDRILIDRLMKEQEQQVMRDTVAATVQRLTGLINQQNWEGMLKLLETIDVRLKDEETTGEVRQQLTAVLDKIGESTALKGLIEKENLLPQEVDQARRVISILGERALAPLIQALKSASRMQERAYLMSLLREFGDIQQPLLLKELRDSNPWFVYRNILQVLAEVGAEESLGAISEKLKHLDSRVRAEAVNAAVRIAKSKATPYLAQGLEDEDSEVRARAASLVGICPTPRIMTLVLQLLQANSLGQEQPYGVQITACLALGQFDSPEARKILLQILHPRMFSPYRNKAPEIRSAAVTALTEHLHHQDARQAVEQAMRDRNATVRYAAQRIWQQYLLKSQTPPNA